jgi:hypothetical protein
MKSKHVMVVYLFLISLLPFPSAAQELKDNPDYPARIILLKKEITFLKNTLTTRIHQQVRILTKDGLGYANVGLEYQSEKEKTEIVHAKIIQPDGTVLTLDSAGIKDQPFPEAGNNYFSDRRKITLTFPKAVIGSVIDLCYMKTSDKSLFRGDFSLTENMQSRIPIDSVYWNLKIDKSSKRKARFKFVNHDPLNPAVTENESYTEYLLTRGNIHAFNAAAQQKMPYFIASTWETWDQFIGWWYPLYQDKIVPDDSIKNIVAKLITGKQKPFDKAKSISEWVRDNIRYVAVEYGDAGYEPREASYIYRQRYGDCKDKAVLTIAMLKQAEINAYPVLVSTGRDVEDDFPSNQFNHAIIAVPADTAMIFFDPTDPRYDYGFVSSKYVFKKQAVVTGKKITFMQPVPYLSKNEIAEYLWLHIKDNTVQGHIKYYLFGKINNKVSKELNIADQSKRNYKCEEYIVSSKMLYGLTAKDIEYRILTGDSSYISADISSFPVMHESDQNLYLNLAAFASRAKTFYFYPLKNKSSFKLESFKRTALIEFSLSPGMTVISVPANKEVNNQFGKFFRRYSVAENKILLELEENYEQFEFTREDYSTTKVNDYASIEDYFTSVTGEFIGIKNTK